MAVEAFEMVGGSEIMHHPHVQNPRQLDQFYTRPDVATRCVAFLAGFTGTGTGSWLEPSAGSGAFLDAMPRGSVGIDIDPRHPDVIEADFLEWEPAEGDYIVAGNPPFGRQSATVIRFFNHAANFASHIGFVMPRSFEKAHLQRRLDRRFHLVGSLPIEADGFVLSGKPYDIPSVFQVWKRETTLRPPHAPVTSHPHFSFVAREQADFAFQRIGRNAGRVLDTPASRSAISHYFISPIGDIPVARVLAGIDWSEEKSLNAGVPSIGKADLVRRYAESIRQP